MRTTISRWTAKYSTMCGSTSKTPNPSTGNPKTKSKTPSPSNNMAKSSIKFTSPPLASKDGKTTPKRKNLPNPKRKEIHPNSKIQDHLRVGLVMCLMGWRLTNQIQINHSSSTLINSNLKQRKSLDLINLNRRMKLNHLI